MTKARGKVDYIWIYFIFFFSLWCARELWFVQYLDVSGPFTKAILSAVIKIIIWVVPVILLIKQVEKKSPLSYLKLYGSMKKGLIWALCGSTVLMFYFAIVNLLVLNTKVNIYIGFNDLLNTILLVGIIEEVVFRGFLLKKLLDIFNFWKANIVASLMFVSIHFPIWFYKGLFVFPTIMEPILTAFILSIVFGIIYKKTNSLWSVIIIHSFYNFLVSLFY